MSFKKVLELSNKFAQKTDIHNELEKYQAQKIQLEKFYHNFVKNMGAILNEMEGDLLAMKEKKFDKDMWKIFVNVWHDLSKILKETHPSSPYQAAHQLINYVKHRPNKSVIDNLDFLIQNHLKMNEVDFKADSTLQQAQIRSLKLLKIFANQIEEYLDKHPLMPIPQLDPEKFRVERESDIPVIGPDDATNPQGILKKKRQIG